MDSWSVHALKRVVVGAVTAMGLPVDPALAHALLVKAEPPRRAVLAKAPAQVQLWFNEEIEDAYSSLVVLDTEKHPVSDVKFQLAPDDRQPRERNDNEPSKCIASLKFGQVGAGTESVASC